MKSFTREISVLLLASMLATAAACSNGSAETNETTADAGSDTNVTEDVTEAETDRSQVKDNLPDDLDFNGESFTILCRDDGFEYNVETQTGDTVDDAIFNRNSKVSQRLNIDFNVLLRSGWQNYSSEIANIRRDINAGEDDYQFINGYSIWIVSLLPEGLFADLKQYNYIDTSMPWWADKVTEQMTVNGKLYFMTGDINISILHNAIVCYTNKKLLEANNITDIYDTVKNGDWTLSKLSELCKGIYSDLNGDSQKDDDDLYGLVLGPYNSLDGFMGGFRQNVTDFDNEGYPELTINNERMTNIVSELYELTANNPGVNMQSAESDELYNSFKNDGAAFFMFMLKLASQNLRDMTSDYGILPYPKYDETQTEYGTQLQDGHALLCMPVTVKNTDMATAVIEALAAESYRTVTPAYFDDALSVKYARDEGTVEMLQIIRDSTYYNFGYVYVREAYYSLRNTVGKGDNNFASHYTTNEKSWNKVLDEMIEQFAK